MILAGKIFDHSANYYTLKLEPSVVKLVDIESIYLIVEFFLKYPHEVDGSRNGNSCVHCLHTSRELH